MAFELKPGQGSLFKNDRKQKDTHPDYKGSIKLPDGTDCWLSAWIKEGQKGKFMSLSVQPKEGGGSYAGRGRQPSYGGDKDLPVTSGGHHAGQDWEPDPF